MADIFLSYAHEDQPAAKRIVDALAREGLDAWWDHEIPPGRSWDEVIGARISAARVAIVIWSAQSVSSNFVKEEAQLAMDAGKLLPVKVEEVEPPVGFRRTHAANLADWRGQADHRQWRALLTEIRERLGGAGPSPPPRKPPPPPPPSGPKLVPILIGGAIALVIGLVAVMMLNRQAPIEPDSVATATTEEAMMDTTTDGLTTTTTAVPQQQAPDARTIELQYWRSCCDGGGASASDYESYLSRYPRGEFASLARQRIAASIPIEDRVTGDWTRTAGSTGCSQDVTFRRSGSTMTWVNRFASGDQSYDTTWTRISDGVAIYGGGWTLVLRGDELVISERDGERRTCTMRRR